MGRALPALGAAGRGIAEMIRPGAEPSAAAAGSFRFADRVAGQLDDVRLGSLAGRFSLDDIQDIANSPASRAFFDARNGTINIVQEIDGVLLRITAERDEMLIKSVGRLRPEQLENGIQSGRFVPIGVGN